MATETSAKKIVDFQDRVKFRHHKLDVISNWHRLAYKEAGIELPYSPEDTYCYATAYEVDDLGRELEDEQRNPIVNVEATEAYLRKIVKCARAFRHKVEKEYYDDEFTVKVILEEGDKYNRDIYVKYIANRQVACTKKVVGTKVIPEEIIPATTEEVVEWDCRTVSFLADDKD